MKHRIPHDLPHPMARTVTRHALESYRKDFAEYSPQGQWLSDDRATVQFTVMGKVLAGVVEVRPDAIELELDVPFMWRVFRGTAIGIIEREILGWIQRAREGRIP